MAFFRVIIRLLFTQGKAAPCCPRIPRVPTPAEAEDKFVCDGWCDTSRRECGGEPGGRRNFIERCSSCNPSVFVCRDSSRCT
jgi:hypothetical protein